MKFDLESAVKVVNRMVFDPKGLSQEQSDMLLSGAGCEMQLEPVSLGDVEHTYLESGLVEQDPLFSAIITKRNRLDRTMRAFLKAFNNSLTGTGLTAGADVVEDAKAAGGRVAGNVLVSKPRKAGQYAVITAQIPVSDGQSVSIVFYAPDDDPLKIAENDTLIAFRFLLNKRDITHIVAPSNGKDISLRQTTTYLSNVVEKNSEKFKANQAKVGEEKARLESLDTELNSTIAEADAIADRVEQATAKQAETAGKIDDLKSKLDSINNSNKLLEDEIAKLESQPSEPAAADADEQALNIVKELFKNPTLKAAADAVKDDGNGKNIRSLSVIAQIDNGGARGFDRSLFVSNLVGRVKTMSKNGEQDKVDNILTMLDVYNRLADKPAVTKRNSVWKLGNVKDIAIGEPAGQTYDPDNEYDFENSIAGITQLAPNYGIEVINVNRDAEDFEGNGSVAQVTLKKHDSKVVFQVFGDGKMAVFSESGQRLESFRDYTFFGLYSNDPDTLKERLAAFSRGADDQAKVEGEADEIDQEIQGKLDSADYLGGANHWYGLRARPASIGTVPEGQTVILTNEEAKRMFGNIKDERSIRHGAIAYNLELSDQDVNSFELIKLNRSKGAELETASDDWRDFFNDDEAYLIAEAELAGLKLLFKGSDKQHDGAPTLSVRVDQDAKKISVYDLTNADERADMLVRIRQWKDRNEEKDKSTPKSEPVAKATLETLVNLGPEWKGFDEIYTALNTPTNGDVSPQDLSKMKSEYDRKNAQKHLDRPNHQAAQEQIKALITECDNVDVLKRATIKFDGVREFDLIEDRLVDLIGDDEYDKFIEDKETPEPTPEPEPVADNSELEQHLTTLKSIANKEVDLAEANKQLIAVGEYLEANGLDKQYEGELVEAMNATTAMIQEQLAKAQAV